MYQNKGEIFIKNDLKALADNQKEYLKLYSKIRYYTDEEYRRLKNT